MHRCPPHAMARSSIVCIFFALPVVLAQIMTATSNPILTATLSPTASSAKPPTFASIVPSVGTYNYIGCYQETSNNPAAGGIHALSNGTLVGCYCPRQAWYANPQCFQNQSTTMSVESCISLCGSSKYGGLEYGDECWCAPSLNPKSMKQPDSNCTFTCSGNQSEICGGSLL